MTEIRYELVVKGNLYYLFNLRQELTMTRSKAQLVADQRSVIRAKLRSWSITPQEVKGFEQIKRKRKEK